MHKRLLALFLAICTVVLSVPMAILPIAAAEENDKHVLYSTNFSPTSSTFPTFVKRNVAAGTSVPFIYADVTYNGGWQVGYKSTGFPASFTAYEGLYQMDGTVGSNGSLILGTKGDVWSTYGGMYMNTGGMEYTMISGMDYDKDGADNVAGTADDYSYKDGSHQGDATIRYTAEQSGTMEIVINELYFHAEFGAYLDIYHNGSRVGEAYLATDGKYYINNSKTFSSHTSKNCAEDFDTIVIENVAKGDTFDFVSRANNDFNGPYMKEAGMLAASTFNHENGGAEYQHTKRGIRNFDITINFTVQKEAYKTVFSPTHSDTWPSVGTYNMGTLSQNAALPVTYDGLWEVGYKTVTGAADNFTSYTHYVKKDNDTLILSANGKEASGTCYDDFGGMYIEGIGNNTLFSAMSYSNGGVSYTADPTIRYTAEFDSSIAIRVNELFFSSNKGGLKILHNGTEIGRVAARGGQYTWAGGSWTSNGTATNVATDIGALVVAVKPGDHIDFVSYGDSSCYTGTTANKTTVDRAQCGVMDFEFEVEYLGEIPEPDVETWAGLATATVKYNNPHHLFTWKQSATSTSTLGNGVTINSDNVAVINPKLISEGVISPSDNWNTVKTKYAAYLKEAQLAITYPGDITLGIMVGANGQKTYSPAAYRIVGGGRSPYGLSVGGSIGSRTLTNKTNYNWTYDYITDKAYADGAVDAFVALLTTAPTGGTTASDFSLRYSDLPTAPYDERATYAFGNAQGSVYNASTSQPAYLRPASGGEISAYTYTVPKEYGNVSVAITANSLSFYGRDDAANYGAIFRYAIAVDGEIVYPAGAKMTTDSAKTNAWAVCDDTDGTGLADLQAVLQNVALDAAGGSLVQLCTARPATGKPAIDLGLTFTATPTAGSTKMCKVTFVQGEQNIHTMLVPLGEEIDVSALNLPADFGKTGVYIDGSSDVQKLPASITPYRSTVITDYILSSAASFVISSNFAFNIYIYGHAGASEAGVIIDGTYCKAEPIGNGLFRYNIGGINPEDIPTKALSYTPYERLNGVLYEGAAVSTTAEAMLAEYGKNEDVPTAELAQAIWRYSLTAKDYFANKSITIADDLAAVLREADATLATMVSEYKAGTNYTLYPGGRQANTTDFDYCFNAAGLMLEDRLAFAFRVTRSDGANITVQEAEKLLVQVKDEGGNVMVTTENAGYYDITGGKELVFVVKNIPATQYASILTFTVVNGASAKLSDTLSYSVHHFLARVHQPAAGVTATANLFCGLYQFGEATKAYIEAHSENYDFDNVIIIGDSGDKIQNGNPALIDRTYSTANPTTVTAGNFVSLATSTQQGIFKSTGAITLTGLSGNIDFKNSVLIAEGGLIIDGVSNATLSNLIVEGPVILRNCRNVTLAQCQIKHTTGSAVTVEASSSGNMLYNSRISGRVALSNAGTNTTVYESVLLFTEAGLADTATVGTYMQSCRLIGTGTAVTTSADEAIFRFLTVEMSSLSDRGIVVTGGQNILIAQSAVIGTRHSMAIDGADNISVVLNSCVSITANNSKHVYICDNAMNGRVSVSGNNYLLANGNIFPDDNKDHTSVQNSNQNTNGDSLMNVNARLSVGADESLLPHVDKDQFIDMELKTEVKDVSFNPADNGENSIYYYMVQQARNNEYVVVAPGAYKSYGTQRRLTLNDRCANTTLYAYGVYVEQEASDEILAGNGTATDVLLSRNSHVAITDTENITLKGLQVGYALQSSAQAYVVNKTAGSSYVDLTVITGAGMLNDFVSTNDAYFQRGTFYLHRTSRGEFYPFCDLSQQRATKNADGTITIRVEKSVAELISIGDVLCGRAAEGATSIETNDSSNIRYEDMVIYGFAGALCFVETRNLGAVTYYRCADTTTGGAVIDQATYNKYKGYESTYGIDFEMSRDEEGRYRGSLPHVGSVDATHTNSSAQGSQIISCLFENMCDDGTNQKGSNGRLASIVDNGDGTATFIVKDKISETDTNRGQYNKYAMGPELTVGDYAYIYTAAGNGVLTGTVLSSTWLEDRVSTYAPAAEAYQQAMANGVTGYDLSRYMVSQLQVTVTYDTLDLDALEGYDLSLDTPDNLDKVLVDNRSMISDGYLIDNTVIQNTRSRGLLLKTSDGIVRNCTMRNNAKVGIAIIYELFWGEAGISERLLIENNLIENTSYSPKPNDIYKHAPIYIQGLAVDTLDDEYLQNDQITIRGNKMVNRQNVAEPENIPESQWNWLTPVSLYIQGAKNVYIYNNDFGTNPDDEPTATTPSIYLNSVKNVELSNNKYALPIEEAIVGSYYENLFGRDYGTFPYHDDDGTLHIRYQDSFTFPYAVTAISNINITSFVTGTTNKDPNLLVIREDGRTVYADGCGTCTVTLANGDTIHVVIESSAINLLFVTGQSNASGDGSFSKGDAYYDTWNPTYQEYYKRTESTLAYMTWTSQSMSIDIAADKALYQAATGTNREFYDYHDFVPTTLDWESAGNKYGCVPQILSRTDVNFVNAGWSAALAYEFTKQTNERVWIVNASHGGMEIQQFMPSEDGTVLNNEYYQATAVFNLALETLYKEVDAGHFRLNHMAYYWFHGESNSNEAEIGRNNGVYKGENRFVSDRGDRYLEAEEYAAAFAKMHAGFMRDVVYDHNGITKELEYCGIMATRSKVGETTNTYEQVKLVGPRAAHYYMAASQAEGYDNVYIASNVTERWIGATTAEADANVEAYFLETYGTPENFEKIFGYSMPTTAFEVHPNVHYLMKGHNEMGMDCARNTLKILRELGNGYALPEYEEDGATDIQLIAGDGHTVYTSTVKVNVENQAIVMPYFTPTWRICTGASVTVSAGFTYDYSTMTLTRIDSSKNVVTFTVTLGTGESKTFTLTISHSSAFNDNLPTYTVKDGVYTFGSYQGPWSLGYTTFGTGTKATGYTTYSVFKDTNWLSAEGATSAHEPYCSFRVTDWAASCQPYTNLSATICYTAEYSGYVNFTADTFKLNNDAEGAGVILCIMKNGEIVWPTSGAGKTVQNKANWQLFTRTEVTVDNLNDLWQDFYLEVNEGDQIQFALTRHNGLGITVNGQATLKPVVTYVPESAIPEPKPAPSAFKSNLPLYTNLSDGSCTFNGFQGPWTLGYTTFGTGVYTQYSAVQAKNWLTAEQATQAHDPRYCSFWLAQNFAASCQDNKDYALASCGAATLCYTAEATGTVKLSADVFRQNNASGAGTILCVLKNGEMVWPTAGGSMTALTKNDCDWQVFTQTEVTAENLNALWADFRLDVNEGDLIQFCLTRENDLGISANGQTILHPVVTYE